MISIPFASIETTQRKTRIVYEPVGFGLPYQELFDSTDVSGYDLYGLESTNNFKNNFQRAMKRVYEQRGSFGLILRDVIRNGKGADGKGRLNINYISHAGTEWEKEHNVWAPEIGCPVPNDDCEIINGTAILFIPGTIVPFETVKKWKEAVKRFEKYGLDPKYAPFFYRLDSYAIEKFAGRGFYPNSIDGGCFVASLSRLISYSGDERIGTLPAYDETRDGSVPDMSISISSH